MRRRGRRNRHLRETIGCGEKRDVSDKYFFRVTGDNIYETECRRRSILGKEM